MAKVWSSLFFGEIFHDFLSEIIEKKIPDFVSKYKERRHFYVSAFLWLRQRDLKCTEIAFNPLKIKGKKYSSP